MSENHLPAVWRGGPAAVIDVGFPVVLAIGVPAVLLGYEYSPARAVLAALLGLLLTGAAVEAWLRHYRPQIHRSPALQRARAVGLVLALCLVVAMLAEMFLS